MQSQLGIFLVYYGGNYIAAVEDLKSIKPKPGGLRTVKKSMKDTMFVGLIGLLQQRPSNLHVDQKKSSCQLPKFSGNELKEMHITMLDYSNFSRD